MKVVYFGLKMMIELESLQKLFLWHPEEKIYKAGKWTIPAGCSDKKDSENKLVEIWKWKFIYIRFTRHR
jgi:hypothetical protein